MFIGTSRKYFLSSEGMHKIKGNIIRGIRDSFSSSITVKPVTQPAGYTGFLSIEGRVINEGGLYSRAGNSSKMV